MAVFEYYLKKRRGMERRTLDSRALEERLRTIGQAEEAQIPLRAKASVWSAMEQIIF